MDPAIGEVIDGRYEIEAPIGRGGMGTVWRARHVFTNVRVALKLLVDEYDAIAFERFLAEARAASTIGHPAIVEVNDANRMANNQLYLAMELLAGKPLRVAIATGAVSSGDQIRRIGLEILDALGAAHARGIIHRDLKPENIFLVAPSSTVKLLDFGIAKVLGGVSGRSTHTGGVLGTIEYMAPEQLADASEVDGRADLWALAVILYEMIAGMRPFAGATPGEKLQALMKEEPMPIGEIVQVSPQVASFFQIALAKDRSRRFSTAAAMSQALRSLAFAGGALPSAAARLTLGTGTGWVADSGHMPDPALGTGAGWQKPAGNLPGPTLGTGAGWQKPASPTSSSDPYGHDNDRHVSMPSIAPPTPMSTRGPSTMPPTSDPYGRDNDRHASMAPIAPPISTKGPATMPPTSDPYGLGTPSRSGGTPSTPPSDRHGLGTPSTSNPHGRGAPASERHDGGSASIPPSDPYGRDARGGPASIPPDRRDPPTWIPPADPYGRDNDRGKPSTIPPSAAYADHAARGSAQHDDPRAQAPHVHGDVMQGPAHPTPPRRRGRMLVLALAGVVLVGGALAVGIVVGGSRSGGSPDAGVIAATDARVTTDAVVAVVDDARAADASVLIAVADARPRLRDAPTTTRDATTGVVDAASAAPDPPTGVRVDGGLVATCKAGCAKLAGCLLALPSCQQDCENRFMSPECIQNAGSSCEALASCHWARICSRPVKTGGMSCVKAISCHSSVAMQDTAVLCNVCIDHLSPTAARDYARFLICNASIVGKPEQWEPRCKPLSLACTGAKPTP